MAFDVQRIPSEFQSDLQVAIDLLKENGANEIYLFGSLIRFSEPEVRDIDIAVRGIAPSLFFRVYGQLMMKLDHDFDLVDLDSDGRFVRRLVESGSLERVA